ncbi:MAG: lipid-A-disaccharide synthase [bacterium]|nr:lipid-A-disaccharide synthase [bacterium]
MMETRPLRIFISVGEESADRHASRLVRALNQARPGIEWFGFGGEEMRAEGVEILYPLPDLALIGFVEVIKKLPAVFHVKKLAVEAWRKRKPDAILLVDYPGLHLNFAKQAHSMGIPVLYYIAPQAWAWREKRVDLMRETLARLLVIFPFEEHFFASRGVPAEYVGHPLIERIPEAAPVEQRAPLNEPEIGLLPGSRRNELKHLLPPMIKAAEIVRAALPRARFFMPLAETLPDSFLASFNPPPWLETGRDPDYQRRSRLTYAWTASGTATVENALLGLPMAVTYHSNPINVFLGRRLIRIPYIGMVNLIAEKGICPEFVQEQCHPAQLARHALELLSNPERYREMIGDLGVVRRKMGGAPASSRAAQSILNYFDSKNYPA